jgi:hypothetical protein
MKTNFKKIINFLNSNIFCKTLNILLITGLLVLTIYATYSQTKLIIEFDRLLKIKDEHIKSLEIKLNQQS